jgi:hypothetical protein
MNFAAEWLALLLLFRHVPGSVLGSLTGYPEVFCGFRQFFQTNAGRVP